MGPRVWDTAAIPSEAAVVPPVQMIAPAAVEAAVDGVQSEAAADGVHSTGAEDRNSSSVCEGQVAPRKWMPRTGRFLSTQTRHKTTTLN